MTDPLLDALKTVPHVTKAARLRALMPEIERQVSEGKRWEDIIAHLNEAGLEIPRETFKSYLYRYRRKLRSASAQPAITQPADIEPTAPERNTDRNTGIDPEPITDGNPDSDTPSPEPDPVEAKRPTLADILDAKKSNALTDQYMNSRKPLLGRKRSENK